MRRSIVLQTVSAPISTLDEAFDGFEDLDAIVYDLDGTLVRLAVDWEQVATDVDRVLRSRDCDPPAGLWAMLEFAEVQGYRALVEETIGSHERKGARESDRLALADRVGDERFADGANASETERERRPIGVCSLNCEAACRIALDTHDLADRVETVVGRDSVATYKPDPEPLLTVVETLDAVPERTLFVGDSERDERTAKRARTGFVYVSDLLSDDGD